MNILIIINDASYGSEKAYNALRLANQILRDHKDVTLNIFLLADGVICGLDNQKTPDGYYNIARMLKMVTRKKGEVKACGACMDARGINEQMLLEGVERGSMQIFAQWTVEADKVINF